MKQTLKAVFTQVKKGAIVLTPNRRLSAFLHQTFALSQKKSDLQTWETPQILPFSSYINTLLWDLVSDKPALVLSAIQSVSLWERIIHSSSKGQGLLDVGASALLAQKAFRTLIQYELAFEPPFSEEVDAFIAWKTTYLAICKEHHWLDPDLSNQQCLKAIQALSHREPHFPGSILFIGFDEWTPLLAHFYRSLENLQISLQRITLSYQTAEPSRIACPDQKSEIKAAGMWAKQQLAEHAFVGIIVPELAKHRKTVVSMVQEVFPHTQVNISAPIPIEQYPLIDRALLLLEIALNFQKIPLADLSLLLRMASLNGAQAESFVRARVQTCLYEQGQAYWSLEGLMAFIQNLDLSCEALLDSLKRLGDIAQTLKTQQKHATGFWLTKIQAILNEVGWPWACSLETIDHQLLSKWEMLLADYLSLDCIIGQHTFEISVYTIKKLAKKIEFLPETKSAQVHILGLLEATGIPFDAAWILSLNQETWPLKPDPNPFIPLSLQYKLGLPRSSSARELSMARRFMQTLCDTVKGPLRFSYVQKQEGRQLFPSQLILSFSEIAPFCEREAKNQNKARDFRVDYFEEANVPIDTHAEKVQGGAYTLSLQAACPFRAFSEIRLKALPLVPASEFLTAKERGEILHDCLSRLNSAPTHKEIEQTVSARLKAQQNQKAHTMLEAYLAVEQKRLIYKLEKWFLFTKTHLPTSIIAQEQKLKAKVGPLAFSVRLDRIDQFNSGEVLIIDYKTGACSVQDWEGPRMNAPQLPLYAIASSLTPVGILFARIWEGGIQCKGLIQTGDFAIPGVKMIPNWSEKIAQWQTDLNQLALAFQSGTVVVDPKHPKLTCRYCALGAFCRVT